MKVRAAVSLLACLVLWACSANGGAAQPGSAAAAGPALFAARDADSVIYLYGTIHLRRPGESWGGAHVEAALAEADEIWTEMEISPQVDAKSQQLALMEGLAPPDQPLSSWLTNEERVRLAATAQRFGLRAEQLEPLRPWLAGLTLSLLPMTQAGYSPEAGVDRAIDAFGDTHGKHMRAFETPEQQIALFSSMTPELQRQMLLEAIDEIDRGPAMLDEMSSAWERGDLVLLERLLNEEMEGEHPDVFQALIVRRNNAWVATLMQELEGQGADFVAVGAAHLVGAEGLVEQLRARGVRVERVEPR